MRAVECLVRCVFVVYSKLLGLGAAGATGVVLLLGIGVLLSNEAARAAVNLIALWPAGKVNH